MLYQPKSEPEALLSQPLGLLQTVGRDFRLLLGFAAYFLKAQLITLHVKRPLKGSSLECQIAQIRQLKSLNHLGKQQRALGLILLFQVVLFAFALGIGLVINTKIQGLFYPPCLLHPLSLAGLELCHLRQCKFANPKLYKERLEVQ